MLYGVEVGGYIVVREGKYPFYSLACDPLIKYKTLVLYGAFVSYWESTRFRYKTRVCNTM